MKGLMKMVTTEKILQTMNSWQTGEVIAVRRKKCSGASSRPNVHCSHNFFWFREYGLLWSVIKWFMIGQNICIKFTKKFWTFLAENVTIFYFFESLLFYYLKSPHRV